MLRKFKIAIDGKEYLVEMEELDVKTNQPLTNVTAPEVPVITPPITPTPVKQPEVPVSSVSASTAADTMVAPMPGNILKILVEVGQTVKENQPIMILEAMKMENEIVAEKAGIIKAIYVDQGMMVNPGDSLVLIG